MAPSKPLNNPPWLRILVVLLILGGVFLSVFYAARLWRMAVEIRRNHLHPGATDVQLIQNWMTVPYIARAYKLPEDYLWKGLGIPAESNRRRSLRTLDRVYAANQPDVILNKTKELTLEYLAQHSPTPTPRPQ